MKQALWSMCLAVSMLLMGCPPTGVVCKEGTLPCGTGCIDPRADRRNCGACGTACGAQQDCNAGVCQCRTGTTLCDGACVDTSYDPQHCGTTGCGVSCAAGQVCDQGACTTTCSPGLTLCVASCVDLQGDEANCGACGAGCAQGQTCKQGVCDYEAVAACYWSGQLVGFDPATGVKGPLSDVGSNPAALARLGARLLAADGTDKRLYSALPTTSGAYALANTASVTGSVPNQVLVDGQLVYVINAGTHTLQVLREGAEDGGVLRFDAGVAATALGTIGEVSFGMNAFPQGMAKVGAQLFVPLYGGYGAEAADAGQAIVKVDVSNPAQPTLAGSVSLKALDLKPFDGGTPVARPWAITARGGQVYAALNNLNPDTYAPEGPGLLAKLDPVSGAVTGIDLGASDCLNPQWVAPVGDKLAVSCGGLVAYDPTTFAVESVSAAGLVVLDAQDQRLGAWSSAGACPGGADAGACLPMMPGRFAVTGNRVVLSDQNGGRVVVLEVTDAGLRELRGAGDALDVCPVSSTTGVANVADVLSR
jgi:hypothetical protein